jgi:hypothetical protein
VSTELGAKQVNQLKVVSDNDNGKSLTLCTSIIRTSLTCDRNWPMCSYVIITVEFPVGKAPHQSTTYMIFDTT